MLNISKLILFKKHKIVINVTEEIQRVIYIKSINTA